MTAKKQRTGRGKRAQAKPRTRKRPPMNVAKAEAADAVPIRHVVLLMLENRSFDQMLGLLKSDLPDLDGVPANPPATNADPEEQIYPQQAGAAAKVDPDPGHEWANVQEQLEEDNGRFVKNYARLHPKTTRAQRQQIMSCFAPDTLPALHALARAFVVCDHWHASVPGPTWTNRLFAMSGTSLGFVEMPAGIAPSHFHTYEQPSVFRRLREANRSYRIYFGDFPLALLLADQRSFSSAKNFSRMSRFFSDTKGGEASFPEFSFIEPSYLWPGTNDDHPPHDVNDGQRLVADVYEALRANEELWNSTLLVVTYDEHGGFFDHVVPPTEGVVPPDEHHQEGCTFDQLGVRVPAILVSPWLDAMRCHERFDHTSLLRWLQKEWGLGDLGRRTASATSPLDVVPLRTAPRSDAPVKILPAAKAAKAKRLAKRAAEAPPLNGNQLAILALSDFLASKSKQKPAAKGKAAAAALTTKVRGPADKSRLARDRATQFLKERGAKL